MRTPPRRARNRALTDCALQTACLSSHSGRKILTEEYRTSAEATEKWHKRMGL